MSYTLITTLGYGEIFGPPGALTVEELLADIPSAPIIELIASWTSQLHIDPVDLKKQSLVTNRFINALPHDVRMTFLNAVKKYQGHVVILSTITGCHFYQVVFRNFNNSVYRSLSQDQLVKILKAYLLLTDKWSLKPLATFEKNPIPSSGNVDDLWKITIPMWVPYQEELRTRDIKIEFFKGNSLPEFLTINNTFSLLSQAYLLSNELQSWKQYFANIFGIYGPLHMGGDTIPSCFVVDDNNSLKKWLNKISINASKVEISDDFKDFREKPIFKKSDNEFVALNPNFILDKLFLGLMFDLGHSKETLAEFGSFENYRSVLSNLFADNQLFRQVITEYHRTCRVCLSASQFEDMRAEIQPDFYARRYQELFIYEFKDVLLNSKIKHAYDFDSIESEVSRKVMWR